MRAAERQRGKVPEVAERRRESSRKWYVSHQEAACASSAQWRKQNPHAVQKQKQRFYQRHAERIRAERKAWREANPEQVARWACNSDPETIAKARERARNYKRANPERMRALSRKWLSTPQGKIYNRIRARMREVLRFGEKRSRTLELLGFTVEELRTHLERQFLRGMSWDNMDKWHIDHIVPLSSFQVSGPDDPELRRAWALTNLRPLWAEDNLAKSDKRLTLL